MDEHKSTESAPLRPIERRILKWLDGTQDGKKHTPEDLSQRFRRSPQHIERIRELATWKLSHSFAHQASATVLRPIERRVLKLVAGEVGGAAQSSEEIADRFRRGAGHIGRIHQLATWKLSRS
jgi:hypothetical protein